MRLDDHWMAQASIGVETTTREPIEKLWTMIQEYANAVYQAQENGWISKDIAQKKGYITRLSYPLPVTQHYGQYHLENGRR